VWLLRKSLIGGPAQDIDLKYPDTLFGPGSYLSFFRCDVPFSVPPPPLIVLRLVVNYLFSADPGRGLCCATGGEKRPSISSGQLRSPSTFGKVCFCLLRRIDLGSVSFPHRLFVFFFFAPGAPPPSIFVWTSRVHPEARCSLCVTKPLFFFVLQAPGWRGSSPAVYH